MEKEWRCYRAEGIAYFFIAAPTLPKKLMFGGGNRIFFYYRSDFVFAKGDQAEVPDTSFLFHAVTSSK